MSCGIPLQDYSIGLRDKNFLSTRVLFSVVVMVWGFPNFCNLSPVNGLFTNERQSALRLGGGVFENILY
jgi:hypothetical protein